MFIKHPFDDMWINRNDISTITWNAFYIEFYVRGERFAARCPRTVPALESVESFAERVWKFHEKWSVFVYQVVLNMVPNFELCDKDEIKRRVNEVLGGLGEMED